MSDVALPEDLAVTPVDPWPVMTGGAAEWPYRSLSLVAPRIYYVRLFHTQPHQAAENAALELGRKIAEGAYAGLIMDYRGALIDHDRQGFQAVADAFAASFPRDLLMVYLHDRDTAPFAGLMLRQLRERGVKVARMADFQRAWSAIVDQLNTPAG